MLLAGTASAKAAAVTPCAPEEVQRRIREHRTADVVLTLQQANGQPLANTEVTVRQIQHKFLFGCNAFEINTADQGTVQQDYQKQFADVMNFATLPFYWGSYESAPGKTAETKLRMIADWCASQNLRVKGHPLCWHMVSPRWLTGKSNAEILQLQLSRTEREVTSFRGKVLVWDAVNEAVIMPSYKKEPALPGVCQQIGRVELIKQVFAMARKNAPENQLLLNDYDTSPKFEALIKEVLAAGVAIDAIGIQSHMHDGYFGNDRIWEICQRFAQFKKPLHFTEATIISGPSRKNTDAFGRANDWSSTPEGERQQAEHVREFYSLLFSHPAVEAITWWDFSDHRAWMGAPAGLIRKDSSPKPAYIVLKNLIKKDWWTAEVKAKTDAKGQVKIHGFLGNYKLEALGKSATFSLEKAGPGAMAVRMN